MSEEQTGMPWAWIKHHDYCALNGHWMEASDDDCTCGLAKELAATRPAPKADGLVDELERCKLALHATTTTEGAVTEYFISQNLRDRILAALKDRDVVLEEATRPLISIENRTPLEVFDIMCDRIRYLKERV